MLRFLLSPRWIGLAIFVVAMAVTCYVLGGWQYDRWEQRKADNAVVEANLEAKPAPVSDVLADGWDPDLEYRTVSATGTFDSAHEVTVRFAHRDSQPGVQVITPLRLTDGRVVLVDRGWIQGPRNGEAPEDVPAAPTGPITITGWLQPASTADTAATTPRDGQVRAVNSARWTKFLGSEPLPGYIEMTEPKQDGLKAPEDPDLGTGPHLFYALQWYFFMGLALLGYVWFARDEVRNQRQAKLTRSA
ncbi:SURF1 family protein [Aeromicrobium senzhongii]|uniref:SURF1-like protein n=1 Tax=Aeromicrobium senzhongii TaxID=2663859 RepID=A0ABX6SPT8_9ACTN|nr:SURF1 family protein [Aeromicrobium senzhongii]MTB86996.1 SURF1 family protein [Aeromicrobium senzhongii]QNL93178.1 SURF1 family protein [Aeromicrobium senzhongii]